MVDLDADPQGRGMHWCVGMYGSASTWVFNAVMQVAAVAQPAPVLGRFVTNGGELVPLAGADRCVVVKSHDVDAAGTRMLQDQPGSVWISVRDPRDCVASLMRYMRQDFATALAFTERSGRFCLEQRGHPKARLLRYESRFMDDPATLDRIAAAFGHRLDDAARARIFAALQRTSIERFIDGLEAMPTAHRHESGDVVDLATQWHRHHANRTGEIGRWRHELSLPQVAAVEQRLHDVMVACEYRAEVAPYGLRIGALAWCEPH